MFQKRLEQEYDESTEQNGNGTLVAAETLRSAAVAPVAQKLAPPKEEEKMSLFWRVFGGTILSIVALVVITLYNNLTSTIAELRNDLNREREARTGLAKKDDVDSRSKSQYDRIRAVEGYKVDIEAIKERVGASMVAVDTVRKDLSSSMDGIKKDTACLEVLKERVTALEGVKKDIASIDAVKEKVGNLALDLKSTRDEIQKLQQDLDKNRAADLERKSSRDGEAKRLDETLKDLQKAVQDCREKLARLEGSQPIPPAPTPKTNRTSEKKSAVDEEK